MWWKQESTYCTSFSVTVRSPVLVLALMQPSHAVSAWCWGSPAAPAKVCRLRRRADVLCVLQVKSQSHKALLWHTPWLPT